MCNLQSQVDTATEAWEGDRGRMYTIYYTILCYAMLYYTIEGRDVTRTGPLFSAAAPRVTAARPAAPDRLGKHLPLMLHLLSYFSKSD